MSRGREHIHEIIRGDPRVPSVADVVQLLSLQSQRKHAALLATVSRAFARPSLMENDDHRIASVKVGLALLPSTAPHVERALRRFRSKMDYELHFTLFCFLDEVPGLSRGCEFSARIPGLVAEYLLHVPKETACAAWMAGDLLGDHWHLATGDGLLRRAAREARYRSGRAGAVHGLHMAASRGQGRRRDEIILLLREVAQRDSSSSVQASARVALGLLKTRKGR